MIILGIETSGKVAGVSVSNDDKIISEIYVNTKLVHSVKLIEFIDECLKNASLNVKDVDVFACSVGPGSFTGIRIGVSTVKGFSYASNKPCVAVNSIEALCYNFYNSENYLIPIVDAKSNKLFSGVFKFENGHLKNIEKIDIRDIDDVKKMVFQYNGYLLGEGLDAYDFSEYNNIAPSFVRYQRASNVCILAYKKAILGQTCSHFDLLPIYMKKSYAEGS